MRIIAILCLFLSANVYSQNLYQVVKSSRKGVRLQRTITVARVHERLAKRALEGRTLITRPKVTLNAERAIVNVEIRQDRCHPSQLAGGYNYFRVVNKKLKTSPQWRGVTESSMYNGVHHIVTQTVIDAIAKEVNIKDTKEMKANAPAVYSPLHGNQQHSDLFHDHAALLATYQAAGVYGIVTKFYERLNEKNRELGLPIYDEEVIALTLAEAELWAKHWGIRWK